MYPSAIDMVVAQPFADDRARELGDDVQIVLAPTGETMLHLDANADIPVSWITALKCTSANKAIAVIGWQAIADFLPKTVAILRDRLAGLGVLVSRSEPPSLLYFFVLDDEITVFEGLPPIQVDQNNTVKPAEVIVMQHIHNGWFEFYSGDIGPMPESEWPVIGADLPSHDRFVGVVSKGSALAGFEPGAEGVPARVLWPDDGIVETPPSLFDPVDDWIDTAIGNAELQV